MFMLHIIIGEMAEVIKDAVFFGQTADEVKKIAIMEGYEEEDFVGIYELNLIEGEEKLPDVMED